MADYPAADGWTLTYSLNGKGAIAPIVATVNADDSNGYSVTVAAVTTAAYVAGNYSYIARVALAGEVYTVDSGVVLVTPNVATAATGALQTHAEQMVALIRVEIKARLSGTAGTGHNSYTIDGRAIEKFSLAELRGLLKGYEFELAAEKNGGRLPPYRVGFSRA